MTGRVALTGQTVQIPDVLDDAEYSDGAQPIVRYRAFSVSRSCSTRS